MVSLQRYTIKLAYQIMNQRAKQELHPSAEVIYIDGIVRVLIGKIPKEEEETMERRISLFKSVAMGEAFLVSSELILAIMLENKRCLPIKYFNIMLENTGRAEIIFDLDSAKKDKISSSRIQETKKIFDFSINKIEQNMVVPYNRPFKIA